MLSPVVIMFIMSNAGLFSYLIMRAGVPAPFVLPLLACLMVITHAPWISIGLRDIVYGR